MTPDKTTSRTLRRSWNLLDTELEPRVRHGQDPNATPYERPEEITRCIGIFVPASSHAISNRHPTWDKELE